MMRLRLPALIRYWWNDQRFQFPMHFYCPVHEVELHAWTNSASVEAKLAATWRSGHDQCEGATDAR